MNRNENRGEMAVSIPCCARVSLISALALSARGPGGPAHGLPGGAGRGAERLAPPGAPQPERRRLRGPGRHRRPGPERGLGGAPRHRDAGGRGALLGGAAQRHGRARHGGAARRQLLRGAGAHRGGPGGPAEEDLRAALGAVVNVAFAGFFGGFSMVSDGLRPVNGRF